ncbi:MAG TPA: esterase-like activity of phytase family protein [Gemmatimonas sp.]|nr:esterase-like activity of phytase family protein [Gemmatimonas sp.]
MPQHSSIVVSAALVLLIGCAEQQPPTALASAAINAPVAAKNGDVVHVGTVGESGVLSVDGAVTTYNTGYGSAVALVPGTSRDFYLLTDRGPNIDLAGGNKGFVAPGFTPRIVRAHLSGNKLRIDGSIPLRRADGTPLTGLPIGAGGCGSTGEIGFTLGTVPVALPADPNGLDSEGLVALPDGTFWLSDEYGPFIAHYGADGREIQRLSPCPGGGLPPVYLKRRPNRGMEGLTITPDGKWLVGIMQAPLENPSSTGVRNTSRFTRILFRNLTTGATKEYGYLLEDATLQGNSEILALSDTRFLVLERDGNFLANAPTTLFKRIYEADISAATEISTLGALGATPIPATASTGARTLEQATAAQLAAARIVTARKTLAVDLALVGYPHDKAEGLALAPGGMLFVSNDDDFGITSGSGFSLIQKLLPPTNVVDFVSLWQVRLR